MIFGFLTWPLCKSLKCSLLGVWRTDFTIIMVLYSKDSYGIIYLKHTPR